MDSLQVFTLNETGMFLVEVLRDGVATREGLVARMVEDFEVDEAEVIYWGRCPECRAAARDSPGD